MWMLCVVLGSLHIQKSCWPVESEARCNQAMHEWLDRSHAWSARSKLDLRFLSACVPPDWEARRELAARERPPR
jgi:hypothetical protein